MSIQLYALNVWLHRSYLTVFPSSFHKTTAYANSSGIETHSIVPLHERSENRILKFGNLNVQIFEILYKVTVFVYIVMIHEIHLVSCELFKVHINPLDSFFPTLNILLPCIPRYILLSLQHHSMWSVEKLYILELWLCDYGGRNAIILIYLL